MFLALLIVTPLLAFWAWMVREMTRNPYLTDAQRNVWMIILLFGNVFGAAIYYWYVYRAGD